MFRRCQSFGSAFPQARLSRSRSRKRFQEKFNLAIHSFYGASECGGICYDREAANEVEGFVGEAMKGVGLEMVDPNAVSDPDSSTQRRSGRWLFSRTG